ncbi:Uncharacterised protein [Mycobacteroides abscessus subsp. abscessus]|nr:Uncharacterised protein [Mycobacteroides abscessus subsp. abscessus]
MCRSTTHSRAAAREFSSSSSCGRRQLSRPGSFIAWTVAFQVRSASARAYRFPTVVGSPAKTNRPPGLSTRSTSRNDSSTSGMWCSTAWPTTRSKVLSS